MTIIVNIAKWVVNMTFYYSPIRIWRVPISIKAEHALKQSGDKCKFLATVNSTNFCQIMQIFGNDAQAQLIFIKFINEYAMDKAYGLTDSIFIS